MSPAPVVTDPPPFELAAQLQDLSAALDEQVPAKRLDRNLLIATWNLREFGRVTAKWRSGPADSPKRDIFSVRVIAEIIRHFDVVAIQEVQPRIDALRMLMRALGPAWGLILTDAVKTQAGDNERLAFVFDTRRAKPSGLACELVVPDEQLRKGVGADALQEQFARTPYAVAFRSEDEIFVLVTLHVKFGRSDEPGQRLPELKTIAKWMRDWADDPADDTSQNLMVLGDFNIDREGDPNYEAFTAQGLSPPAELIGLPRTLPTKSAGPKYYDQIAWFKEEGRSKLTLGYGGRAGTLRWNDYVLRGLNRDEVSFRVSDHYPLWCEFLLSRM